MRKYRRPSSVTQSTTTRGRQRQGLPCAARQAGEKKGGMEAFFFFTSLWEAPARQQRLTRRRLPDRRSGPGHGLAGKAWLCSQTFNSSIHSSTNPSQAPGVMGRRPRCVPASAKRESQFPVSRAEQGMAAAIMLHWQKPPTLAVSSSFARPSRLSPAMLMPPRPQ